MRSNFLLGPFVVAVAALLATPLTSAQSLRPAGYFTEGALLGRGDWALGGGVIWPIAWQSSVLGNPLSAFAEGSINHWEARVANGRKGFTHFALVPILRMHFGSSAWFADAGIGVSVTDQLFVSQTKQFTTAFNFVDVVGVGLGFGTGRAQNLSVRIQHVSNAGIRRPNPGQNFLQLRYASAF